MSYIDCIARASVWPGSLTGKLMAPWGTYNAHLAAYPAFPGRGFARALVEGLGLEFNGLHDADRAITDALAECCDALARLNTVLIQISIGTCGVHLLGYFRQRVVEGEVGSSTMRTRVNPI